MVCTLCVKYSDSLLSIFKTDGLTLGIADIIRRHFWLKLHPDDDRSAAICSPCWLKLNDFHQFYKTVEQAHSALTDDSIKKEPLSELMDIEFVDPDLNIKEEPDEKTNSKAKQSTDISREMINQFCELEMPSASSNGTTDIEAELQNPFSELSSHDIKNDNIFENIEKHDEFEGNVTNSPENTGINPTNTEMRKNQKYVTRQLMTSKRMKRKAERDESSKKKDCPEKVKGRSSIKSNSEDDEMVKKYIPMICELCTFISTDYSSIRKHFRKQHPKMKSYVRCCNKKLFHRLEIVRHAYKHDNPEFFKCKDCKKNFAEQSTLSRHMITAHAPEEELNYHCDQCPKRFPCQKKLEIHKNSHVPQNERVFVCDQCPNSRFASNDLLKIHICMRHRRPTNVCHVCAKEIRDKASFEKHVRSHFDDGGPKVKCTLEGCDRWLKDEDNLRRHIRRLHSKDQKAVTCDTCGRECKNQDALTRHKYRVHSNVVFTCEECKKTFKRAIYLREHMAQHTGEILYKCPFCTRTSNSNANMHSHKKKMHPLEWENWKKTNNGNSRQLLSEQQKNKPNSYTLCNN